MSGNHYTEYKYYSSHDLIDKVNRWCSGFYLNSVKFAEMRETLRIRIKLLNNYNINHAVFEKNNIQNELIRGLINDYKLYCKYECNDLGVELSPTNQHMNRYFKNLHKQLLSALNQLDRCWGYRGVWGYGMNYGKCHIELELDTIRIHRDLNTVIECLKKVAEKTGNEDCIRTLTELKQL